VWGIRGGDDGKLVDRFLDGGYVAVAFPDLGDGRRLERFQVLRTLERAEVPAAAEVAARFQVFFQGVAVGDPVLMPDVGRKEIVVGIVEGEYAFEESLPPSQLRHRRAVRWIGRHDKDDLPGAWTDLYKQRQAIKRYEARALNDHVAAVEAGEVGRPATQRSLGRVVRSSSGGSSTPRTPRAPRAPKPPPRQLRTCPSCGFNLNIVQFEGQDLCRDCR
jgi:predicted Mrr-cat superfamily restriction endonuclease